MRKRVAFIDIKEKLESWPACISLLMVDFFEKNRNEVIADYSTNSMEIETVLSKLGCCDLVVSMTARSNAVFLSRFNSSVINLDWRCISTQILSDCDFDEYLSRYGVNKENHNGYVKTVPWLIYELMLSHLGKTDRSQTNFDLLIKRGTWPVFSVEEPELSIISNEIEFSRVFPEVFSKCSLATQFYLWSRPGMDNMVGYPQGGFIVGGKLPSAFHIEKSKNLWLALRVDAGEHLFLKTARVTDACFELTLV